MPFPRPGYAHTAGADDMRHEQARRPEPDATRANFHHASCSRKANSWPDGKDCVVDFVLLEDVNDSKGNRFFQPMNAGVDLDAPVKVVTVEPRFAGKKLWELMKGPDKAALRKEIVGAYCPLSKVICSGACSHYPAYSQFFKEFNKNLFPGGMTRQHLEKTRLFRISGSTPRSSFQVKLP